MKSRVMIIVLLVFAFGLIPQQLSAQSRENGGKSVLQVLAEGLRAMTIARAVEAEEQAFIAQYGYAIPVSVENVAAMMLRIGANPDEAKPIVDLMVQKAKQYPDPSVAQRQWLQMMTMLQSQQWGSYESQMRLQQIQQERKSFEQERLKSWAESFGNPYQ